MMANAPAGCGLQLSNKGFVSDHIRAPGPILKVVSPWRATSGSARQNGGARARAREATTRFVEKERGAVGRHRAAGGACFTAHRGVGHLEPGRVSLEVVFQEQGVKSTENHNNTLT